MAVHRLGGVQRVTCFLGRITLATVFKWSHLTLSSTNFVFYSSFYNVWLSCKSYRPVLKQTHLQLFLCLLPVIITVRLCHTGEIAVKKRWETETIAVSGWSGHRRHQWEASQRSALSHTVGFARLRNNKLRININNFKIPVTIGHTKKYRPLSRKVMLFLVRFLAYLLYNETRPTCNKMAYFDKGRLD